MSIHDKLDAQGLTTWLITSVVGGLTWGVWKLLKTVFTDRQRIDTAMQAMRILTTRLDDMARDAEKREDARAKQRDEDRETVRDEFRSVKANMQHLSEEIRDMLRSGR